MKSVSKLLRLNSSERKLVFELIDKFEKNRSLIQTMLDQLRLAIEANKELMTIVHSLRWRVKDREHLKDKLTRRILSAKQEKRQFDITLANLFERVNDLAGLRILHLHNAQISIIDEHLRGLFEEYKYEIVEEPKARTWDDESREFYKRLGFEAVDSPTLYTSVHYVIASNSQTRLTCELQVRTLAEELWGEVDHSMNYPHACSVDTCREQIKVLARVTSSCSRLVDSIFRAAERYGKTTGRQKT